MKISKLLHKCNIRKSYRRHSGEKSGDKRSAFEIFQFLLLLAFQGYNLFRIVALLAARVISYFDTLTKPTRFKAFVLDDSVIGRKRSKKVELLAFIFDHVTGKKIKGFNLLALGWTDAYSFVPVAFTMMSSANGKMRINEPKEDIDKRTVGYKNRTAALKKKPEAALNLIKQV